MSCGEGCRRGSDPALLWLWCRLAATALIRPLAWESPYATGAALEKAKSQNQKTKQNKNLETNENGNKMIQNLWDIAKAVYCFVLFLGPHSWYMKFPG